MSVVEASALCLDAVTGQVYGPYLYSWANLTCQEHIWDIFQPKIKRKKLLCLKKRRLVLAYYLYDYKVLFSN